MSSCADLSLASFAEAPRARLGGLTPWIVLAVGLHGAALAMHTTLPAAPRPPERTLEVELAPRPSAPPTPPPPAPVDEPKAAPVKPSAARAPHATEAHAPPPVAARAGAVLAAESDSDAPVSFVTDPQGGTYGLGVVARGATADRGTGVRVAAPPSAPRAPAPAGDAITPASNLSRAPKLEEADACRGFFPTAAEADAGLVTLAVVIHPSGAVASVAVVTESPAGDGFGAAATACLRAKRFAPGLAKDGQPTRAAATVRIRFTR